VQRTYFPAHEKNSSKTLEAVKNYFQYENPNGVFTYKSKA